MGRRAVHTDETLLDAAVELFAAGGAQAVTMVAVARATGAPSGSVYHRFPDRPALLAAMWRRTTRDFQDGYLAALGPDPTPQSAVAAAVWTIDWCRAHPGPAALLHAGQRTLQPETWPTATDATDAAAGGAKATATNGAVADTTGAVADTTGAVADTNGAADIAERARAARLGAAIRSIAAGTGQPRDEVAFALLDLPLAVVRPYLRAGEPVPKAASDRVRRLATRVLLG